MIHIAIIKLLPVGFILLFPLPSGVQFRPLHMCHVLSCTLEHLCLFFTPACFSPLLFLFLLLSASSSYLLTSFLSFSVGSDVLYIGPVKGEPHVGRTSSPVTFLLTVFLPLIYTSLKILMQQGVLSFLLYLQSMEMQFWVVFSH